MSPIIGSFNSGSAFGRRGKNTPPGQTVDVRINATLSGNVSEGGNLAQYFASMVFGANTPGNVSPQFLKTQGEFQRVGNGILTFTMPSGNYIWRSRSSSGSGSSHYTFMEATGTMTFSSNTSVMLLVPNHGAGSYSGGGGLFFIQGSNFSSPGNAILVIGGGGGGYSASNANQAVGPFTNNTSTASTRRQTSSDFAYDGGAGFLNTYTPESYQGQEPKALHFTQGGAGGGSTACGNERGGFGGGGGACPAGGGGYVGGRAGGNSPNALGGGGGTSYYNTTYISNVPTVLVNSIASNTNRSNTSLDSSAAGYFEIYSSP